MLTKSEFKAVFDLALSAPAPTLREAYTVQPLLSKAEAVGNQMKEDHMLVPLSPEELAIVQDMRKSLKAAQEEAAKIAKQAPPPAIDKAVKTALAS